jgi:ribonuclease HI
VKKKGVVSNDLCSICGQERETANHVIWGCIPAQDVWGSCDRSLQKMLNRECEFVRLVDELLGKLNDEDLGFFAIISKGIWKRRNKVINGRLFSHPITMVNSARELHSQFKLALERNAEPTVSSREEDVVKWCPPPTGCFKANWDAATSGDQKKTGVGVIIRDERGLVIAALSRTIFANFDPQTVEATTALHAVELCKDIGVQDNFLEGDAFTVVKAIAFRTSTWHNFGQIVDDIQVVLGSKRSWRVGHIKRGANGAAHGLAKEALRSNNDKIWMEDYPSCISQIVNSECEALSL